MLKVLLKLKSGQNIDSDRKTEKIYPESVSKGIEKHFVARKKDH